MIKPMPRRAPALTRLTSKSQITVPIEVRRALGLRPGDRVAVRAAGDFAVLLPLRGDWTDHLRGLGAAEWRALGGADRFLEEERGSWGRGRRR
jgi:AbrB family looped-hinge helix DNA binding protein